MAHKTAEHGRRPAGNTTCYGFAFKAIVKTSNALTTNASTPLLSFKGGDLKGLLSYMLDYAHINFSKLHTNKAIH